jgi:hypothetical protein
VIMESAITIADYLPEHRPAIRKILTKIGWAQQYISAMEIAVNVFSKDPETYGVYLVVASGDAVGFLYVQYYTWNQLCQIQGLAVSPEFQRQGAARLHWLPAPKNLPARKRHAASTWILPPRTGVGENSTKRPGISSGTSCRATMKTGWTG